MAASAFERFVALIHDFCEFDSVISSEASYMFIIIFFLSLSLCACASRNEKKWKLWKYFVD